MNVLADPTCRRHAGGWGGTPVDVGSGRWPNVLVVGAQKAICTVHTYCLFTPGRPSVHTFCSHLKAASTSVFLHLESALDASGQRAVCHSPAHEGEPA